MHLLFVCRALEQSFVQGSPQVLIGLVHGLLASLPHGGSGRLRYTVHIHDVAVNLLQSLTGWIQFAFSTVTGNGGVAALVLAEQLSHAENCEVPERH